MQFTLRIEKLGDHAVVTVNGDECKEEELLSLFKQAWSYVSGDRSPSVRQSLARLVEIGDKMNQQLTKYFADRAVSDQAISDGLDKIGAGATEVGTEMAALNALIKQLQDSQGTTWTTEDQAVLDAATAKGESLATKTGAMSDAVTALESVSPPAQPPASALG